VTDTHLFIADSNPAAGRARVIDNSIAGVA
jgi:hypothetical protein